MKNLKNIGLAVLGLFVISCNNDDTAPPVTNEEELITTVRVKLTNGTNVITLTYTDLDGDGAIAPTTNVIGNILANTTYTGTVEFLNESINPIVDITPEVLAEGTDHQVFYQKPTALGTISYTDLDTNGKPIGLQFSYATASAASGNLTISLIHLPNKSASGVSLGNITNAGGATDVEVTLPITVQ